MPSIRRSVTAIVNVGDDLEVLGLSVSPDLDSVLYALAGIADEERGWGRADETWNALATVESLGGESWFRLGDRDLGLHAVRTQALREGVPLSAVTAKLAAALRVEPRSFPRPTSSCARARHANGSFSSRNGSSPGPTATGRPVRVEGATAKHGPRRVYSRRCTGRPILIAPSNPFVSIGPILAVSESVRARATPRVPASPSAR